MPTKAELETESAISALDALRKEKIKERVVSNVLPVVAEVSATPKQPEQLLARLQKSAGITVERLRGVEGSIQTALATPEFPDEELDSLTTQATMLRKKIDYFKEAGKEISKGKYNDTSYYDELTALFGKTPYGDIVGDLSAAKAFRATD